MMYVKTNSSNSSKRVTQMGVPMKEISPKGTSSSSTSYVRNPSPKSGSKTSNGKEKRISSGKVIFFSLIIGALGLMYLNHVFSTQKKLKEVNLLQREYVKVKRLYADRKFTYDRMIGPAEVYERAKKLGLKDGGPADGVIYVEK